MRQAVEAYPQDRTPWLLLQSSSQKPGQPPTHQSPYPEPTVFSRPYVRVWIPSCWNSLVPKKSRTDIASVPAFLSAANLEAQFPHVQVKRLDKMFSSPFIELPWSLLSRGQHKVHFWFLAFSCMKCAVLMGRFRLLSSSTIPLVVSVLACVCVVLM